MEAARAVGDTAGDGLGLVTTLVGVVLVLVFFLTAK